VFKLAGNESCYQRRRRKMDLERNYIAELIVLWVKVGLIYLIVSAISDKSFGLMAAGFIFGVTFFNKVVPFNLFGNTDAVRYFWLIKIVLSAMIGFIAFPIVTGYYIINIFLSIARRIKMKSRVGE